MKTWLMSAAALAGLTALAAPANALIVNATANGNSVDTSASTDGVLAADVDFSAFSGGTAFVVLDVTLEDADLGDSLDFNGIMNNLSGLYNFKGFSLVLDGTVFDAVGDVFPIFSTGESVMGGAGDNRIDILFGAPGEPFGVELGDVGFGGSNFGIDIAGLGAGDGFSLELIADVPAPGVLGLLGLGVAFMAARQRGLMKR